MSVLTHQKRLFTLPLNERESHARIPTHTHTLQIHSITAHYYCKGKKSQTSREEEKEGERFFWGIENWEEAICYMNKFLLLCDNDNTGGEKSDETDVELFLS